MAEIQNNPEQTGIQDSIDRIAKYNQARFKSSIQQESKYLDSMMSQFNKLPESVQESLSSVETEIITRTEALANIQRHSTEGARSSLGNLYSTIGNTQGVTSRAVSSFTELRNIFNSLVGEIPVIGHLLQKIFSGNLAAMGLASSLFITQQMVAAAGRAREERVAYGSLMQTSGLEYFDKATFKQLDFVVDNMKQQYQILPKESIRLMTDIQRNINPLAIGSGEGSLDTLFKQLFAFAAFTPEISKEQQVDIIGVMFRELHVPVKDLATSFAALISSARAMKEINGMQVSDYVDYTMKLAGGLKYFGVDIASAGKIVSTFGKFLAEGTIGVQSLIVAMAPTNMTAGMKSIVANALGVTGNVLEQQWKIAFAGSEDKAWYKNLGLAKGKIKLSPEMLWAQELISAAKMSGGASEVLLQMASTGVFKGISNDPVTMGRILGTILDMTGGITGLQGMAPADLVDIIVKASLPGNYTLEQIIKQGNYRLTDSTTILRNILNKMEAFFDVCLKLPIFRTNEPTIFRTNEPTIFRTNEPTIFRTNEPTRFSEDTSISGKHKSSSGKHKSSSGKHKSSSGKHKSSALEQENKRLLAGMTDEEVEIFIGITGGDTYDYTQEDMSAAIKAAKEKKPVKEKKKSVKEKKKPVKIDSRFIHKIAPINVIPDSIHGSLQTGVSVNIASLNINGMNEAAIDKALVELKQEIYRAYHQAAMC